MIEPRKSSMLNHPVSLTSGDSMPVLFSDSKYLELVLVPHLIEISHRDYQTWTTQQKEIVTNIIAAMTNAFQVSERLNTPKSKVSISPISRAIVDY